MEEPLSCGKLWRSIVHLLLHDNQYLSLRPETNGILSCTVPSFTSSFAEHSASLERVNKLLEIPEVARTFKPKNPVSDPPVKESLVSMSIISKGTPRFVLDDLDSRDNLRVKQEVTKGATKDLVPDSRPTGSRIKMVKKRKVSHLKLLACFVDQDDLGMEGILHEAVKLVKSYFTDVALETERREKRISELEKELVAKRRNETEWATTIADLIEKLNGAEAQRRRDVSAAVEEAKDATTIGIFEAMVKMAKEAMDTTFSRDTWEVRRWEKLIEELKSEEGGKIEAEAAVVATE